MYICMTLLYILYTLEKRHRSNSSEKKKDMFYIYIYIKRKKVKKHFCSRRNQS